MGRQIPTGVPIASLRSHPSLVHLAKGCFFMNRKFFCVFFAVLFFCAAMVGHVQSASAETLAGGGHMLKDVKSYKIFYDAPTAKILAKMKDYDMVIIEPVYYTKQQIDTIKSAGTKVFGYINSMEADNWNTGLTKYLQADDYYYKDNEKYYLPVWDAYLMNMASSHYRSVLLNQIKTHIQDKGIDGIFFDTAGDIDDYFYDQSSVLKQQRNGFVSLLQQVKKQFPSKEIIQNWGIDTLTAATSPYVDGIMWENFNQPIVAKDDWAQEKIKELNALQKKKPFTVLTVSNNTHSKSQWYSQSVGFIHYSAKKEYSLW